VQAASRQREPGRGFERLTQAAKNRVHHLLSARPTTRHRLLEARSRGQVTDDEGKLVIEVEPVDLGGGKVRPGLELLDARGELGQMVRTLEPEVPDQDRPAVLPVEPAQQLGLRVDVDDLEPLVVGGQCSPRVAPQDWRLGARSWSRQPRCVEDLQEGVTAVRTVSKAQGSARKGRDLLAA
jgi:hypothetical protein